MPDPKLLTSAQTAESLGIDRGTLSRWVANGQIAVALRLPGKTGTILFDPLEVERVKHERSKGRITQ